MIVRRLLQFDMLKVGDSVLLMRLCVRQALLIVDIIGSLGYNVVAVEIKYLGENT
jgi:hypothetical protein